MQVTILSSGMWIPSVTYGSGKGLQSQVGGQRLVATKVTCAVLIMNVLLMFQLSGNKGVQFKHILSFTQRAFCWTDMIQFHFKEQFPTLANLGVEVAGAYVDKSIFSVRKKPYLP